VCLCFRLCGVKGGVGRVLSDAWLTVSLCVSRPLRLVGQLFLTFHKLMGGGDTGVYVMKWADRMNGKLDVMMMTFQAISYSDVIQLLISPLHSIVDLTSQGE